MKLLAALLIGLTSTTFAQTTTDQRFVTFSLNQANVSLNLDQKDFQTIYRTDQVPHTCYRDEIQGTRTACHTEYDRRCHTESYNDCRNVPRRVCRTTNNCRNVPDRVCNSHGCTTINRRVCSPSQSCSTTTDRVCRTETRNVCNNIPRNVCVQVPNHVKVPYACTRAVQVPIGQELKFQTIAQVSINLVNFAEVGATPDLLVANLNGGMVFITSQAPATNAFIYQVVGEQRSEQMTGAIQKTVTYQVSVVATSIQKLNESLNSQITNTKLFYDHLDFTLNALNIPLKGHLKVVQYYRRRAYIIIDADFAANALVRQSGVEHLSFAPFGVNVLENATHLVELTLNIDLAKLQVGVINPGAMVQVSNKSILSSFEAIPTQQ